MTENEPRDETADVVLEGRRAGTGSDAELSRDDMFHVLQCRRRRLVFKYLHERDGGGYARMSDIAERIAAFEHDTTVDALSSKERQRVYIALYQSHLPKMDEIGVIDYDQDRGLVGTSELTDRVEPYVAEEPSLLSDDAADDRADRGSMGELADANG